MTQEALVPTIVMPRTAPTIVCVVETGSPNRVAARRNSAPEAKAHTIPSSYTPIRFDSPLEQLQQSSRRK